eukprot:m.33210 g.33210  ORF g.33210 m.33210 type:complete len:68 (+) comp5082_c0_seq1:64-267(+)
MSLWLNKVNQVPQLQQLFKGSAEPLYRHTAQDKVVWTVMKLGTLVVFAGTLGGIVNLAFLKVKKAEK